MLRTERLGCGCNVGRTRLHRDPFAFVASEVALSRMKWRNSVLLAALFVVSVAALGVMHHLGDWHWIGKHLRITPGSDGVLWQVQTTLLAVGFAGLAIAAQLFAETPLAVGASRGRVLEHVRAGWFVGVGLFGNAVLGVEAMWLPSDLGALSVAACWFVSSVGLLLVSYFALIRLFGNPSQLDEVVRSSLVSAFNARIDAAARKYADANAQLEGLFDSELSIAELGSGASTLSVAVPRVGLVIRSIRPQVVRSAIALLGPAITFFEDGVEEGASKDVYLPPQITLGVEPGDRTRAGDTAFRVHTSRALDADLETSVVRLLQSSVEFESPVSVTPDEQTNREIDTIKDAVGTSLRSGAFSTAQRALDLLGEVVRHVWVALDAGANAPRRSSFIRRDWLYRSIGDVERDVTLSSRACGLFISEAMSRAIEASRTGPPEYLDECLRSFIRLWQDILRGGNREFEGAVERIVISVQNLAEFSGASGERQDVRARATWAFVELVKLALDARRPDAAQLAATELSKLFRYGIDAKEPRANVRAGQLVLSGWIAYLADKKDERDPKDDHLVKLLTPSGTYQEILAARSVADSAVTPFTRWDMWEVQASPSGTAQMLQLSGYIDRAELRALSQTYGAMPPATDDTVSRYRRLVQLLGEGDPQLTPGEDNLKSALQAALDDWTAGENARLADEPLSETRTDDLRRGLRETLHSGARLAAEIRHFDEIPASADASTPILGMNFRVPRHYLVEKIFKSVYADPKQLGSSFARGYIEGEEGKIVGELRSLSGVTKPGTVAAIREQIQSLRSEAEHYVLVTPYSGMLDFEEWYAKESQEAIERVTHFESAALDHEAFLFDRRDTLRSHRRPETKEGLVVIEGTSIALGVFEDIKGEDEPLVRIETGEYFVVWPGEGPHLYRFLGDVDDQAASGGAAF